MVTKEFPMDRRNPQRGRGREGESDSHLVFSILWSRAIIQVNTGTPTKHSLEKLKITVCS